MDRVFIENLAVSAVIGVYDWERAVRQTVVLDLEMAWDIGAVAAGDGLEHALDYAAVSRHAEAYVQQGEFRLLETLAEHLAADLRRHFGIAWLRLRVAKPGAVPGAGSVGVIIERGEV